MPERHIVAMGGGGFSDADPLLDDFVLGLTGSDRPRVCFVPTASGDAAAYVERFYAAFTRRPCEPSHLPLFQPPYPEIGERLLAQDVIYVGGGSTANMLAIWRIHGVDEVMRRAWEHGTVLCGVSAGGMCWFEASVTDSLGPQVAPMRDGLGLLAGSLCPHYDSEPARRAAYHRFVRERRLPPGLALDDGVALHFVRTELAETVANRRGAVAHRVELRDGEVVETLVEPRVLAGRDVDSRPSDGSPT
jgi:peptidase E